MCTGKTNLSIFAAQLPSLSRLWTFSPISAVAIIQTDLFNRPFLRFWSNKSNTRKSISSDLQTLRSGLEKRGLPNFFFQTSNTVIISFVFSSWIINKFENAQQWPGACFSKVPKLFGPISEATNPFISSQRRGSKPWTVAILLVFLTLKICSKISFSRQADGSLTTGFPDPKSSRDFVPSPTNAARQTQRDVLIVGSPPYVFLWVS